MEHLHKGAKWLFRIRAYFVLIFLMLFVGGWIGGFFVLLMDLSSLTIWLSVVVSLLVIIVIGEIYAYLAYKNWKYELTPHALKIERGIIFKNYKSIPYERVQNVDIYRGILARVLKFSTLNIQTAGYHYSGKGRAMAEGHIPAVSVQGAEKIREFLMKRIGRRQGL